MKSPVKYINWTAHPASLSSMWQKIQNMLKIHLKTMGYIALLLKGAINVIFVAPVSKIMVLNTGNWAW